MIKKGDPKRVESVAWESKAGAHFTEGSEETENLRELRPDSGALGKVITI